MTFTIEHQNDYTLIKVAGSFDAHELENTQFIFDQLIKQADKHFVIDVHAVTRIDTSGLAVIVFLFKRLYTAGLGLTLTGVQGQPLKKIRSIGLDKTIEVQPFLHHEKKLIIFGEDWGRFPSSTQHLASGLLNLGWKIIWINSIGMRKPKLSRSWIKRLYHKFWLFFHPQQRTETKRIQANLHVVNPLVIPLYGYRVIDTINRFLLRKQMASLITNKKFSHAPVWSTLPTAYPFLAMFNHQPLIYYCCDEYSGLEGVDARKITRLENSMIGVANLIIVSSDVLAQKMPAEKTMFLDHGVNFQAFQKHFPRPDDLPKGKPIAGFFGTLASWIDIDLLMTCAKRLPAWNFVLIGPCTVDMTELLTLDNVFYLGRKPWQALPAYPQHWEVSILPLKQNKHTQACNPMQIKEYLACGKPVVSTDIPALKIYQPFLYLVNHAEEFVKAIEMAQFDQNQASRKEVAKESDWQNKAIRLEHALLELENSYGHAFTHSELINSLKPD